MLIDLYSVAGQEVEEVEEELRPVYDERELTELVSGLTLFLEYKHTLCGMNYGQSQIIFKIKSNYPFPEIIELTLFLRL